MTESNGTNMIMPVAPTGFGGGFGGFGGESGWWIILLFVLLGGWNNGGFTGSGVGGEVQRGFDQAAVMGGVNSITSGISDLQQTISNGFATAEVANNSRQMANMNQMFALQSAMQNCCCENRAATADLKYTVATEACADRAAISSALRDVIEANTASTQRILDQLCADKIDAKNEKIADLERQLTMANLAASQNAQTAAILANNEAQTSALEQYLAPIPRPSYIVQNPNCCTYNSGCGCGSF